MPDKPCAASDAADWIKAIALRQDRAAFASLFELFAPRIKAMLMRSGAAADAAEDVAQEALLTVWRKATYFTRRGMDIHHCAQSPHRSAARR
jgi:RNA polymerase sigma-70 factor (ECF subfamily)